MLSGRRRQRIFQTCVRGLSVGEKVFGTTAEGSGPIRGQSKGSNSSKHLWYNYLEEYCPLSNWVSPLFSLLVLHFAERFNYCYPYNEDCQQKMFEYECRLYMNLLRFIYPLLSALCGMFDSMSCFNNYHPSFLLTVGYCLSVCLFLSCPCLSLCLSLCVSLSLSLSLVFIYGTTYLWQSDLVSHWALSSVNFVHTLK